jgi:lipase
MNWTEKDFVRDGVRLHYRVAGHGEPLVLLHGVTDSGACWGRAANRLAQTNKVIALDQRGHGRSDAPAPGNYRRKEYVADIAALIEDEANDLANVMGHSFGGSNALAFAATQPQRVKKLILVDPPFLAADERQNATEEELGINRKAWFQWLRDLRKLPHDELKKLCHAQSPNWSDDECDAWATSKLLVSPRIWERGGIDWDNQWRSLLISNSRPTLIVRGEPALGSLIGDDIAAEAMRLNANVHVATVMKGGHSLHRDQHDAFMNVIEAFL